MKTLTVILFLLVLIIPGVFAQQGKGEQGEQNSELPSLLSRFGRLANLTLTLICLNDSTVEALFAAPRKYAMRAQATALAEGSQFGGLVVLENQLDLDKSFTIINGDLRFTFDLSVPVD